MNSIFVYEWCTAIGIGRDPTDAEHSLYREGLAMRDAVAGDFAAAGHDVVLMEPEETNRDGERQVFLEKSRHADAALVIAPELDGILLERCRWVEECGVHLVGPDIPSVALCSNKLDLAKHWTQHRVPTPRSCAIDDAILPTLKYPAIIKRVDGAGSVGVRRVDSIKELRECLTLSESLPQQLFVQEFVTGIAASLSILCGVNNRVPLLPASQILSTDGQFRYLGGEIPLSPELAGRATQLALRAITNIPGLRGYIGVDIVLGADPCGKDDYAIEINPRLTTSYVGLRHLCESNLAELMLKAATGEAMSSPTWKTGFVASASGLHEACRVRFDPTGYVTTAS